MGVTNYAQGGSIYEKERNRSVDIDSRSLNDRSCSPCIGSRKRNRCIASSINTDHRPLWDSTKIVVPSITVSGKQISVSVYISSISSATTTTGTLYLEEASGNSWTPVTSWPIDATGKVDITKTYCGTTGVTYRTRVVVTTGADEIDVASNPRTV